MVAVAELTTLDPGVLDRLDFDLSIPCEANCHDSDDPAVWSALFDRECCGVSVVTICEACRLNLVEYEWTVARMMLRGPVECLCGRCGGRYTHRDAIITPLRGGS